MSGVKNMMYGGVISDELPKLNSDLYHMISEYLDTPSLSNVTKLDKGNRTTTPSFFAELIQPGRMLEIINAKPENRRWEAFLKLCRIRSIADGQLLKVAQGVHRTVRRPISEMDPVTSREYGTVGRDLLAALTPDRPFLAEYLLQGKMITRIVWQLLVHELMKEDDTDTADRLLSAGLHEMEAHETEPPDLSPQVITYVQFPRNISAKVLQWFTRAPAGPDGVLDPIRQYIQRNLYQMDLSRVRYLYQNGWRAGIELAFSRLFEPTTAELWFRAFPDITNSDAAREKVTFVLDETRRVMCVPWGLPSRSATLVARRSAVASLRERVTMYEMNAARLRQLRQQNVQLNDASRNAIRQLLTLSFTGDDLPAVVRRLAEFLLEVFQYMVADGHFSDAEVAYTEKLLTLLRDFIRVKDGWENNERRAQLIRELNLLAARGPSS